MILARENINIHWDGKRASMTAGEVLRKPAPAYLNRFTFLVLAVVLISGLGVGRIALDHRISTQWTQLEKMQDTALILRTENDTMQQKIRSLSQLEKVEKIALQKLKMVEPETGQMMLVRHPVPVKNQ